MANKVKTIRFPLTILLTALLAAAIMTGCGNPASPPQSTPSAKPSTAPPPAASATPTVKPEEGKPALSDSITLPDGWTMDKAVSVSDIEALVNDTGYTVFPEASSDSANGNPAGGFVKKDANGNLKLTFLAFVNGKEEKYNFFKDFVVEGTLKEIDSELWDKAFIGDFSDKSAAVVALRGDLCIRVNWYPEAYPQFDKAEFGTKLAELLINNLFGG